MDDLGGAVFAMAGLIIVVMVALWVLYSLFSMIRPRRPPTAQEILKQRYARGEISEQQYKKMLADLDV